MKIFVVGFNDLQFKQHGQAQRFQPEHCFYTDRIPTESEMLKYVKMLGYWRGGAKGVHPEKCDPVYFYTEVLHG